MNVARKAVRELDERQRKVAALSRTAAQDLARVWSLGCGHRCRARGIAPAGLSAVERLNPLNDKSAPPDRGDQVGRFVRSWQDTADPRRCTTISGGRVGTTLKWGDEVPTEQTVGVRPLTFLSPAAVIDGRLAHSEASAVDDRVSGVEVTLA